MTWEIAEHKLDGLKNKKSETFGTIIISSLVLSTDAKQATSREM